MSEDATETPQATSLVDLIDGLIEPGEPAPIPLVPQTWGWVVLVVIVLAGAVWLVARLRARHRASAYRRAALAELARADTGADVARILRRAALVAYPRATVAGLTGDDWLDFLAQTGGDFPAAAGADLLAAPYRSETSPPSDALRQAAAAWVRDHRTDQPDAPQQGAVA